MKTLFTLFISLITFYSFGQETEKPELIGDRPDQTESAFVLPKGYFQFEDGFVNEYESSDVQNISYSSMLLRYGLFDNIELRFGTDYLKTKQELFDDLSGFAPIYMGAKIHVQEEKGWIPQIAFLGHITIANTGAKDYLQKYHSSQMVLTFNHTINDKISVGYSLGVEFPSEIDYAIGTYTLVTGFALTEKMGAFAEIYGDFSKNMYADNKINGGVTYLALPNLQLDFAGGFGLSQNSAKSYYSVGLIYLFKLK